MGNLTASLKALSPSERPWKHHLERAHRTLLTEFLLLPYGSRLAKKAESGLRTKATRSGRAMLAILSRDGTFGDKDCWSMESIR